MRNFIQPGNVVTLPATAVTGCKSGDIVAVGALIGVAACDAAAGDPVEVATEGVFELPKSTGQIDVGDPVFWSGTIVTEVATDAPLGICTETAGSAAVIVRVKLDPRAAADLALDGRVTAVES